MFELLPRLTTRRTVAPVMQDPFVDLRRDVMRLFDEYFGGPLSLFREEEEALWPKVDIVETEKAYRIVAELPGVDEDHIDVSVVDHTLVLSGEKREEKTETDKEGRMIRAERFYGSFRRSFPLPEDADIDHIKAESKNGLLTIVIPRLATEQARGRKIKVTRK